MSAPDDPNSAQRATTVLGWIAGASLGLMLSIALRVWLGSGYPLAFGNAGGIILGAFAGMAVADRLGPRALRPLAFVTGLLVLVAGTAVLLLTQAPSP